MADVYQALSDEQVRKLAYDHHSQIEGKTKA